MLRGLVIMCTTSLTTPHFGSWILDTVCRRTHGLGVDLSPTSRPAGPIWPSLSSSPVAHISSHRTPGHRKLNVHGRSRGDPPNGRLAHIHRTTNSLLTPLSIAQLSSRLNGRSLISATWRRHHVHSIRVRGCHRQQPRAFQANRKSAVPIQHEPTD